MKHMRRLLNRKGQGMTEYIILVVILALGSIESWNLFRTALSAYWRKRISYGLSLPMP
jgi:Flp pilus assembly pilin Flp